MRPITSALELSYVHTVGHAAGGRAAPDGQAAVDERGQRGERVLSARGRKVTFASI